MARIERQDSGFEINVSEKSFGRFSVHAKNANEIGEAMKHYFGSEYHANFKDDCPICRRLKAKEKIAKSA